MYCAMPVSFNWSGVAALLDLANAKVESRTATQRRMANLTFDLR